jgi:hypothetical protein
MRAFVRACTAASLLAACAPSRLPDTVTTNAGAADAGARAAGAILGSLSDSARREALYALDGAERTTWNFVPIARRGAKVFDLSAQSRASLDTLLLTALSARGHETAFGIVRNEELLGRLEREAGRANPQLVRDTARYYLTVYGAPAADSAWGWRFEGHHLSLNVTSVGRGGRIAAPLFMGANPARVPSGPEAGRRLLAAEEDAAWQLLALLGAEQRARAVIAGTTFGDIVTRNAPRVDGVATAGLPASAMSEAQRDGLRRLLEVYLARFAPEVAASQRARIERAGFGRLHFAWAGSLAPGRPHYYRIHGPTMLVEYDNTQNDANHVHTVWRDLENDFGGDLLRRHYAEHRHRR